MGDRLRAVEDLVTGSADLPPLRRAAPRTRSPTSGSRRSRTRTSPPPSARSGARRSTRCTPTSASACLLVQLAESATPEEIFSDYAYFSSYSDSWVEHARRYVETMVERFGLGRREPGRRGRDATTATCCSSSWSAASRCSASSRRRTSRRQQIERGIPTLRRVLRRASSPAGSRTRARPPTSWSATTCSRTSRTCTTSSRGCASCSSRTASITMEFPHLLQLIEERQFDTIYHEHFSYFSLLTVERLFARARARALRRRGAADPRRLAAHLRAPRRPDGGAGEAARRAARARAGRRARPARDLSRRSARRSRAVKRDLLAFLVGAKRGRAARSPPTAPPRRATRCSTTAGSARDLVDYVVDRSPHKQGRYLPGTRLPIHAPEHVRGDAARLPADPALEPRATRSPSRWRTSATGAAGSSSRSRASRSLTEAATVLEAESPAAGARSTS